MHDVTKVPFCSRHPNQKTQHLLKLKLHNYLWHEYTTNCCSEEHIHCCLNEQMQPEVDLVPPHHLRWSFCKNSEMLKVADYCRKELHPKRCKSPVSASGNDMELSKHVRNSKCNLLYVFNRRLQYRTLALDVNIPLRWTNFTKEVLLDLYSATLTLREILTYRTNMAMTDKNLLVIKKKCVTLVNKNLLKFRTKDIETLTNTMLMSFLLHLPWVKSCLQRLHWRQCNKTKDFMPFLIRTCKILRGSMLLFSKGF